MHRLLAIIFFVALLPQQTHNQSISKDQASHPAASDQTTDPSPAEQSSSGKHRQAETSNYKDKRDHSNPLDGLSVVLTVVIAAAACVQAGAAVWQGFIYRKQSRLTVSGLRVATRAARASRDSADASRESIESSKEHGIRELRAYIGVHQSGIQGHQSGGDPIGVGFSFVNYGKTPASKFNMVGALDWLPYPLPEDFVLSDPDPRPRQDGIIFPKESNPMTGWVWERKNQLTLEAKQNLFRRDATKEIYAHGTVTYEDVFGQPRVTIFCYVLNPHSVVRNEVGDILHGTNRQINFQFAPVLGRNTVQ